MELKHLLELAISVEELPNLQVLFGSGDKYLRQIRSALDVQISARDSTIRLSGEAGNVTAAAAVIEQLQNQVRRRNHLSDAEVSTAIEQALHRDDAVSGETFGDRLEVYLSGVSIAPKTKGQREYVDAVVVRSPRRRR